MQINNDILIGSVPSSLVGVVLAYCQQRATEETQRALEAIGQLPASIYRDGLANLAQLALNRLS